MNLHDMRIPKEEASAPNAITVLKSEAYPMTKVHIKSDKDIITKPYGNAKEFSSSFYRFNSTNELIFLLNTLSSWRNACIVRGAPTKYCKEEKGRRLLHDQGSIKATFRDVPRIFALLDYDGNAPERSPDLLSDPAGAVHSLIRAKLPESMWAATYWWQLGSSAGVKIGKFSIHLWVMLDQPITRNELAAFCKQQGFDPALASPVQPHYIATPIFVGMKDPIPVRCGVIDGDGAIDASPILKAGQEADIARKIERESRWARFKGPFMSPSTPKRYVDRLSTFELMTQKFSHIITSQGNNGWIQCDCPNHNSLSQKTLHVNLQTGQWHCHGCDVGGGSTRSLSNFLNYHGVGI